MPGGKPAAAVAEVGDLAWAGHHARAIELATTALAAAGANAALKLDLVDLRAESFVALGELERAAADAATMLDIARAARKPALRAQALNRMVLVQMRKGEGPPAVRTAEAALKAARRSKQGTLEAMSLLRLAEAQFRVNASAPAAQNAKRASALFAAAGQPANQGRALWALTAAVSNQGRAAAADKAAGEALALGRRSGDLYGVGNALNMLTFNEPDIATRLRLLTQSLAAFEAAGYLERQGVIINNLGVSYIHLGLSRRARRLLQKARDIYHRTSAQGGLHTNTRLLVEAELQMGHLEAARTYLDEAAAILATRKDARYFGWELVLRGRLAYLDDDAPTALRHCQRAADVFRRAGLDAFECNALAELARVHLAMRNAGVALVATRRAIEMHRAHGLAAIQGMVPAMVWWEHSRALAANGDARAARQALATAYGQMRKGIAGLSDDGLRRNYLNKIPWNREIIGAWLDDARKRRLAPSRRAAHLGGEASLREPFERLVDTGLRLNELRSTAELHEFLIDEATELSGAERVLLVLDAPGRPAAHRLARAARGRCARAAGRHHADAHGCAPCAGGEPHARPRRRARARAALAHRRPADRAARAAGLPVRRSRRRVWPVSRHRPRPAGHARRAGRRGARQRALGAGTGSQGGRAHGRAGGVERAHRAARRGARHRQHRLAAALRASSTRTH